MATARTFDDMLNEHLNYDLLKGEVEKKTWLLDNCTKDDTWKGGTIPVPFKGSQASSAKFGGLTATTSVGQSDYVRGTISSYKEFWGSIRLNHTDYIQHDGKVKEDSFLKLWPNELEDFTNHIKNVASIVLLNGFAARATADGDASGNITVDSPERFTLNQLVYVDDDNSSVTSACYIRTINMNTGVLTLYDAVTGGSVVNLSDYTTAQKAKVYFDGTEPGTDAGFTSLRSQILSASLGGSSTLFGQTKTAYPYLQSILRDGSSATDANFLALLFNEYVTIRKRTGGRATKAVMGYKNGAAVMKALEAGKGAYHIDQKSSKVTAYGWEEIDIVGPKGRLSVVLVQEAEEDLVMVLDPKSICFHTNGMFKERVAPDGKKYFEVRGTDGYYYVIDIMCFGELAMFQPSVNGAIHSIDFALSLS